MLIAAFLDATQRAYGALTAWDQAVGDGDFGDNLRDGLQAAAERIPAGAGIADELAVTAEWFLDHVGGTSGPLFGLLFDAVARHVASVGVAGDDDALDHALVRGLANGTDAIRRVGEAHVGDRTMLDALVPAVDVLQHDRRSAPEGSAPPRRARHTRDEQAGGDPGNSRPDWLGAARVAWQSALDTRNVQARMGRASYLGDRAIGTPDPGAMGAALLLRSLVIARIPGSDAALPNPDGLE